MPQLYKNPLEYPPNSADSVRLFSFPRAPTVADYKNYRLGDEWLDSASHDWWKMTEKTATAGIWQVIGGSAVVTETITGDTGGAVPPDAVNNIDLLGNPDIDFVGTPGTSTVQATNLTKISAYIVDAIAGAAPYQTIQTALDAANAAGIPAVVYVRPGTYTENLTLYDSIDIWGAVGVADTGTCVIVGTHTPPATGAFTIRNINMQSATDILNSAVAGITTIIFIDCLFSVTNGYVFNLLNWTGTLIYFDVGGNSTNDGVINNTGGATVFMTDATIGAGVGNTMIVSGPITLFNVHIQCPITIQGAAVATINGGSWFDNTLTTAATATIDIINSLLSTGATAAINHGSANPLTITTCTIDSTNNPAIAGAGAGAFTIGDVTFLNNAILAGTLTINASTAIIGGPLEIYPTTPAAANDAFAHFVIPGGTQEYALGTDNSDVENFKLTTGASPSLGTLLMNFEPATPSVEIPMRSIIQSVADVGNIISMTTANTDNTNAASGAAHFLTVGGAVADDVFTRYRVTGAGQFSVGIDNSDGDRFKITASANPSAGTEMIVIDVPASEIFFPVTNVTQEATDIGTTVDNTVRNLDNTNAASNAAVLIDTGGASGGDPYLRFRITGVQTYAIGPDNSVAGDPLIFMNGNTPSAGTILFQLTAAGVPSFPTAPLGVASGGTGVNTITDHALIVGSGVAAITEIGPLTNGQLAIGSTGADPVAANLASADGTITITNGAGTIDLSANPAGVYWQVVAAGAQAIAVNAEYLSNNAGGVTFTLPVTAAQGTMFRIAGMNAAGGWTVAQNAGQSIQFLTLVTTVGVGGSLASVGTYESVECVCIVANTTWTVVGSSGNITVT